MKKRFLLACVTYNSYEEVEKFISSVETAVRNAGNVEVTVAVGDNTVENVQDIDSHSNVVEILSFPYRTNLGYLGCAFRMLSEMGSAKLSSYDYVAISNVDIALAPDFFVNFANIDDTGIGWIAPDIYTPGRGTHENPFMLHRPSRLHFLKWEMMYASPLLYGVMEWISCHMHSHRPQVQESMEMYAGHGSFMLFTRAFISTFQSFEYPSFMYAEEIFFAELLLRCHLKVVYQPCLKIDNVGSVSVSLLGKSWKCRNNRDSLRIMRRLFFASPEES